MSDFGNPEQEKYGEPMVWIGIYIAIASSLCILAMASDCIYNGLKGKIWYPCNCFSLNAATIMLISVAMKLPVDISGNMPGYSDQLAKVRSLAFLCMMMANLMPSLAAMDNKSLLANVTGLSILVITIVVNIFIGTYTGVIKDTYSPSPGADSIYNFVRLAYINSAMTLFLLLIMIASSLTIPTLKEILEVKYQACRIKPFSTDQHLQDAHMSKVEELKQNVRRHWVMAVSGSSQFVMATNPLSGVCGLICAIVGFVNLSVVGDPSSPGKPHLLSYGSDYKWSMNFIILSHTFGILIGSLAPGYRGWTVMNFNMVTPSNRIHLVGCFHVEKYWTQVLCEWKESPIQFHFGTRSRALVYTLKSVIISLCIYLQMVIVIFCKVISLIMIFNYTFVSYCLRCWNSIKVRMFTAVPRSHVMKTDLKNYFLVIHDEMKLTKMLLNNILDDVNFCIIEAEKKQNMDLLGLLERSTGFKGVENFVSDNVQPLPLVQLANSWSLPIVTLTCIAVSLPNIHKVTIKHLIRSVSEGLSYTHLTEKCLNSENEYVNIQRATMILWNEVEQKCKWLDKAIGKDAFRGKTTTEILKWFSHRAEEILIKNQRMTEDMVETTPKELIAANSMYRTAVTILRRGENNTILMVEEALFADLSGMIADIFSACFTNLPQVIRVKCNESVIEKREESVKAAAKLLGKTIKIIERLENHELPNMDREKMAYVDEWRRIME